MVPILCLSASLLLATGFANGETCNLCDLYTNPTSILAPCSLKVDPSTWAQMYAECEHLASAGNDLVNHFSAVVSYCKAKGFDIVADFTVCPPASISEECSISDELARRVGGVKDCSDAVSPPIWGSLILDFMGFEERGDIKGKDNLLANLQTLCEAKNKPITFKCQPPTTPAASEEQTTQVKVLNEERTEGNTMFTIYTQTTEASATEAASTEPATTEPVTTQSPCKPCDFSSSPCFQKLSNQIQSAIVRDCTALSGTKDFDSLLDNLALICAAKGESAMEPASCGPPLVTKM